MTQERNVELTKEIIEKINDWGERTFAEACLRVGLSAVYQVPVGDNVIDFMVRTKKGNKLVEVTVYDREQAKECVRKKRQIASMEKSGMNFCLICVDELVNIRKRNFSQKVEI